MVLVVDFDGTLVKENSSRLLEDLLLVYTPLKTIVKLLLLIMGKVLHYKGDFGRFVILNLFVQKQGTKRLIKLIEKVARQLTVREEFKDREFIILSSGLKPIIEYVVKINNLKVIDIYASELIIHGKRVRIIELTPEDKIKILKDLTSRYHTVTYYTDSVKEAQKCKTIGIHVELVHSIV